MMDIKDRKASLRKKYKIIRDNMIPEKKKIMDEQIIRNLFLLDKYQKNKLILTYVSKDTEVSTYEIMEEAFSRKKRVAVPKCNIKNHIMDFYYINSFKDLKKGAFGVYEPADICGSDKVNDLTHGVCLVPGFSFDLNGYRLGYGKGYYDRFLSKFKGFTIGLCYANCINFKLPRGQYDKAIDILITDKYVKKIYKPRREVYKMKGKFSGKKFIDFEEKNNGK